MVDAEVDCLAQDRDGSVAVAWRPEDVGAG
jgi:hypothetical protein